MIQVHILYVALHKGTKDLEYITEKPVVTPKLVNQVLAFIHIEFSQKGRNIPSVVEYRRFDGGKSFIYLQYV